MLHNQFDGSVGFSIDGGVKDATHIRRLSTEHNSPMPSIDNALHHLLTARALHAAQARSGSTKYPVLDWSALIGGSRIAAGLEAFESPEASIFTLTCSHLRAQKMKTSLARWPGSRVRISITQCNVRE